MNLPEILKIWREQGEPYDIGVDILQRLHALGYSCNVISIFQGKETSFTRKKLSIELNRIEALDKPKESPKKEYGKVDTSSFPQDLQELYKVTISNLKSMDTYRGQLIEIYYDQSEKPRRFPDEKRGLAIARAIQTLFSINLDNWTRIDYFKEHGVYLPGTEPNSTEISIDRLKYLLSIQIKVYDYLNKARRKVKNGAKINESLFNDYSAIEKEIKEIING